MSGLIKFAIYLVFGAIIGILSAQYVVKGESGLFTRQTGVWTTWPAAGVVNVDPYTRSHFLNFGALPSSRFETVEFTADADSQGRALDSSCIYVLRGELPAARWWSVTSYDSAPDSAPSGASANLISRRAVLNADGSVEIVIAEEPRPGNWFKPAGDDKFIVVLRLYSPASSDQALAPRGSLLSIDRTVCR